MDLNWSDADLEFRDEVRAFFAENLTDDIRDAGRLMTSVYAQHDVAMKWQTILHAKGWVAPAWPVENGGCGWTVLQRYIFTRERVAAGRSASVAHGCSDVWPSPDRLRLGRTEGPFPAAHAQRRAFLVPGLFRTGGGLGPRFVAGWRPWTMGMI